MCRPNPLDATLPPFLSSQSHHHQEFRLKTQATANCAGLHWLPVPRLMPIVMCVVNHTYDPTHPTSANQPNFSIYQTSPHTVSLAQASWLQPMQTT